MKLSIMVLLVMACVLPAFSQQSNQRPVSKDVQRVSNKWLGNENLVTIRSSDYASPVSGKELHKVGKNNIRQAPANVVSAGNADWTISKRVNLIHRRK